MIKKLFFGIALFLSVVSSAAAGTAGGAVHLDGASSSYIETAHDNRLNFTIYDVTWSWWMKTTGTSGYIFDKGSDTAAGYAIFISGASEISATMFGVTHGISTGSAINDGQWHHYVMTYIVSTAAVGLYVDNVSKGTVSFGTGNQNGTAPLDIGRRASGFNDGYFTGDLDEVKFLRGSGYHWGSIEVAYDWNSGVGRMGGKYQQRLGYGFDEGSGNVAHDYTPRELDGTMYNMTWTAGKVEYPVGGVGTYEVGAGKTYATIQAAVSALVDDQGPYTPFASTQTILIYDGTYLEDVMIGVQYMLTPTAANRLVLRAAPGNSPVIDGETTAKQAITLGDMSHVDIIGLECKNTEWYGISFNYGGMGEYSTEDIRVQNCVIHDVTRRHGVLINGYNEGYNSETNNCVVEYCEIYNCNAGAGAGGVAMWTDTHNNVVRFNNIHDCGSGVLISAQVGGYPASTNNEVRNNVIDTCEVGIEMGEEGNKIVDGNIVSNCTTGINQAPLPAVGITWTNNILYDNTSGMFIYNTSGTGMKVYNNTFVGNTYGIWTRYTTSMEIKNNIFYANTSYGIYDDWSTTTPIVDYNCWNTGGVPGAKLMKFVGVDTADFAVWQAAGHDAHGTGADPVLVNVSKNNYHLMNTSPCVDAGADLSAYVPLDFQLRWRPYNSVLDIGAYEDGRTVQSGAFLVRKK